MARKTKEEAQQTRASIMDAAIQVFHDKGFVLSTLDEIAEAAGVTRGAVYWHFKNKLDLITEIHEDMHVSMMGMMLGTENPDTLPSLAQFKDGCVVMLERLENDERQKRIMSVMLHALHTEEAAPLLALKNEKHSVCINTTIAIFEDAIVRGDLKKDNDAELLATAFYCFICGILHTYMRDENAVSPAKQGRALIDVFFSGK